MQILNYLFGHKQGILHNIIVQAQGTNANVSSPNKTTSCEDFEEKIESFQGLAPKAESATKSCSLPMMGSKVYQTALA